MTEISEIYLKMLSIRKTEISRIDSDWLLYLILVSFKAFFFIAPSNFFS